MLAPCLLGLLKQSCSTVTDKVCRVASKAVNSFMLVSVCVCRAAVGP